VGTPISFELTSSGVMNSFFVPQLGGQIYTMFGMVTRLHLLADHIGTYRGMSANYSGAGFSGMHFKVEAVPTEKFAEWVAGTRGSGPVLNTQSYVALGKPSQAVTPFTYREVAPDLFKGIVNSAMNPDDPLCLTNPTSQRADK
jgi:cytochrome o ubiquinol oxidase subunit 2